jgi:hypothetical protein
MPPVFAPLYNLKENACWPSLVARQSISPACASASATQPSKVGLGLVKAACRLLTAGRVVGVTWQRDAQEWNLAYVGDSATVRLRGTRTTWLLPHAKSYHLGLAAIVDGLLLGRDIAIAVEFRARWSHLIARLTELAGSPPYPDWRLAQCAQDQVATEAMLAVTDACYFYVKARAATDGLDVREQILPADGSILDPASAGLLWFPDMRADLASPPPLRPQRRLFSLEDFR